MANQDAHVLEHGVDSFPPHAALVFLAYVLLDEVEKDEHQSGRSDAVLARHSRAVADVQVRTKDN